MMRLGLPSGPLHVLCLAAHPDDVEIGCGGTLLELVAGGDVELVVATLTGTPERRKEAEAAAQAFAPGARSEFWDLPDGRLPSVWNDVKEILEDLAARFRPDVVFAPRRDDSHQDHRLVSELVSTVWRDALVLEYEIPKWDGDLRPVTAYVAVSDENATRKAELLDAHYPSQRPRDWWGTETFLALMHLRGIETRSRYAEGFLVRKAQIEVRSR